MARPKSDDKRNAILAAAVQVFAEEGLAAPTARIAKVAGVAEGTLFTYFSTKDELFNRLYVLLKGELRDVVTHSNPKDDLLKNHLRHAWNGYIHWGLKHPQKRKVIAQLGVSDRITEQSRAELANAFADFNQMLKGGIADGVLRDHPPSFAPAIMASLAETTMDFMARNKKQAGTYLDAGFEAYWNAIACPDRAAIVAPNPPAPAKRTRGVKK